MHILRVSLRCIHQQRRAVMIIAIAHNKGGVGKTTNTLNLAEALKPSFLIDQDVHRPLTAINNLRDEKKRFIVKSFETKADLIDTLKKSETDLVLADCGGFDSELNRIMIAASDLVIVPANDDLTELIGLQQFDGILSQISEQMEKDIQAKVLFCRTQPGRRNFADVEEFLNHAKHLSRLESVLPRRKTFPSALAKGFGVLGLPNTKYSDAAMEVKSLINEIKELMNI